MSLELGKLCCFLKHSTTHHWYIGLVCCSHQDRWPLWPLGVQGHHPHRPSTRSHLSQWQTDTAPAGLPKLWSASPCCPLSTCILSSTSVRSVFKLATKKKKITFNIYYYYSNGNFRFYCELKFSSISERNIHRTGQWVKNSFLSHRSKNL